MLGTRTDSVSVRLALVPAAAVRAAILEVEAATAYGATPTDPRLGGVGGHVAAILLQLLLLLELLLLQLLGRQLASLLHTRAGRIIGIWRGSNVLVKVLLPWAFCASACCSLIFRSIVALAPPPVPAAATSDPCDPVSPGGSVGSGLVSTVRFRYFDCSLLSLGCAG